METNRIKKVIAILLVVLFLVTVTAGAVSAQWGCGWNRCSYSSPKVAEDSANAHIVSSSSPATPYFIKQHPTMAVSNDPAKFKPKTYD